MLFVLGFNSCNGMKIVVPTLMKWVGLTGPDLYRRLVREVRTVLRGEGGDGVAVTLTALEKTTLVKSVVWESLRIEPPVTYQYAKAKEEPRRVLSGEERGDDAGVSAAGDEGREGPRGRRTCSSGMQGRGC